MVDPVTGGGGGHIYSMPELKTPLVSREGQHFCIEIISKVWNHSLSLSPDTTSQLQFNNKVYARAPSCRDLVPPEITFTPGTTSPTNTLRSVCIESDLFRSQPQGCQRAALVVFRLQHRQRRRTSMRSLKREEGWSRGSGLPGQVPLFFFCVHPVLRECVDRQQFWIFQYMR